MGCDYNITLTQISNGTYVPNTTLTPCLKATGNPLIKYTGTHLVDGVYKFTNVDDGKFKLYESDGGTEITKWGGTNGKWIGDDNMEVYATASDMVSVKSATGSLQSQITTLNTNKATLTANNNFTGVNLFGQVKITGGTTSGTKTEFRGWTYFMDCPYLLGGVTPTNYYHLVNKGYVDGLLVATQSFQESSNIVRVISDGVEQTGIVYTSQGSALTYVDAQSPTINKQYTILFTGEGAGSLLSLASVNGKYLHDYVHYRGLGSDIAINLPIVSGTEYTATDYTRVVWEDLTLVINDSENDLVMENITFKNCKFIVLDVSSVTLVGCNFEGTNYFSSAANKITFTSCIGTPIYCTNEQIRGGTNNISYTTPSTLYLGATTKLNQTGLDIGATNINTTGLTSTNLSLAGGGLTLRHNTITNNSGYLAFSAGINTVGVINCGGNLNANGSLSGTNLTTSGALVFANVGVTAPVVGANMSPNAYWGVVDNNQALGEPDGWLNAMVNGASVAIPFYNK